MTSSLVGQAHADLAEPLGQTVRMTLEGPGPKIRFRKFPVGEDPFSVADMPVVIRVGDAGAGERRRTISEEAEQDDDGDGDSHGSAPTQQSV